LGARPVTFSHHSKKKKRAVAGKRDKKTQMTIALPSPEEGECGAPAQGEVNKSARREDGRGGGAQLTSSEENYTTSKCGPGKKKKRETEANGKKGGNFVERRKGYLSFSNGENAWERHDHFSIAGDLKGRASQKKKRTDGKRGGEVEISQEKTP